MIEKGKSMSKEKDIIYCAQDTIHALEDTIKQYAKDLITISHWVLDSFRKSGKLFLFGNGGSAADAQHIAAEFVNRFQIERNPLPALALTTDTSILTSISNDYDFSQVFSKQILALANSNDVALGISTSGNSKNVIEAIKVAKELGLKTAVFTGKDGGLLKDLADISIVVASNKTPRIQEVHIFMGHMLCQLVEDELFSKKN